MNPFTGPARDNKGRKCTDQTSLPGLRGRRDDATSSASVAKVASDATVAPLGSLWQRANFVLIVVIPQQVVGRRQEKREEQHLTGHFTTSLV